MTNWTDQENPVAPWDTPGLPPRRLDQRCSRHSGHCAYRDDDPNRCPQCHRATTKPCACTGPAPKVGDPAPPTVGNRRQMLASIGWATCSGCSEAWSGKTTCHCGNCHHTFTSPTAFDQHRIGSLTNNTRTCADPADRGLVPVFKKYWSGWALPGERPPR